jgi:hypothetical protein
LISWSTPIARTVSPKDPAPASRPHLDLALPGRYLPAGADKRKPICQHLNRGRCQCSVHENNYRSISGPPSALFRKFNVP